MDLVQPALIKAAGNRPAPHPKRKELPPPHDPMLRASCPLHLPVKKFSGQLSTYTVPN